MPPSVARHRMRARMRAVPGALSRGFFWEDFCGLYWEDMRKTKGTNAQVAHQSSRSRDSESHCRCALRATVETTEGSEPRLDAVWRHWFSDPFREAIIRRHQHKKYRTSPEGTSAQLTARLLPP